MQPITPTSPPRRSDSVGGLHRTTTLTLLPPAHSASLEPDDGPPKPEAAPVPLDIALLLPFREEKVLFSIAPPLTEPLCIDRAQPTTTQRGHETETHCN